jgi:hypothetical protein
MRFIDVLIWLQGTPVAHLISKSNHLVGATLQIIHILGFVLMLASLLLVSLRVLGAILTERPVADVARDGTRLLWIGFVQAFASGLLMFTASPLLYFPNPAFKWKMVLLLVAVTLQLTLYRHIIQATRPQPALFVRFGVAVSVAAWLGIALAGRLIGFI